MDRVVTDMKGYVIRPTGITDQTVQILSRPGTVIDLINLKAPTYRKSVKRREKIETIKCQGTSIQVWRMCLCESCFFL